MKQLPILPLLISFAANAQVNLSVNLKPDAAATSGTTEIANADDISCTNTVIYAASEKTPGPAALDWSVVSALETKQIPLQVTLAAGKRKIFRSVMRENFCGAQVTLTSDDAIAKFFASPTPTTTDDQGDAAQDPDELVKAVLDRQDSIEKQTGGYVQFALSVGWRHITDGKNAHSLYDPSIDPADSTLQLDQRNRGAFILSALVVTYPWVKKEAGTKGHGLQWLGFVANVNIAEFANGSAQTSFNKKIEGGYGLAFRFSSHFSLALTYEKILSQRPRDWVIDSQGQQVTGSDGSIVTSIDQTDDNLFIEDNFNAISLKLVYRLK